MENVKLNKKSFTVDSLDSLKSHYFDKKYWEKKSVQERIENIELLRQINYGYDPTTARLQRFFEVVERT